jgi:hypothetical protein
MTSMHCHRCMRLMASCFPVCPHCGAPQDEQSRAESARQQRELWTAVLPPIVGIVAGWFLFQAWWAVLAGLALGLLIGLGLLAAKYARQGKG